MKAIATCSLILIGALFLVSACGADAEDLPAVYECQGHALACASRNMAQCPLGADCHVGGTCSGTPAYCGGLSNAECLSQDGCTLSLDGSIGSCAGVPKPCSDQASQFDCTSMKGCSWTEACAGDKPSCIALTQDQCKLISGCAWTKIN